MLQQKWKLQIQLNVVMMNTSTEVANFHLRLNYRLLFPSKFSCKILKKKNRKAPSICLKNADHAPRGESKPERCSGKRIVAGTAFRLEFQVH